MEMEKSFKSEKLRMSEDHRMKFWSVDLQREFLQVRDLIIFINSLEMEDQYWSLPSWKYRQKVDEKLLKRKDEGRQGDRKLS